MAAPERIFRQAALDRLSSPEQLDQLMQVTTPKSWMSLAAFGALIVTALIWAIFGRIADQVHGPGIFLKSGGVFVVAARGDGSVQELLVQHTDIVTNRQLLARIRQPELEIRLRQAETNFQSADASLQDLQLTHRTEEELQQTDLDAQRAMLTRLTNNYTGLLVNLTAQSNAIIKLLVGQIGTTNDLLGAQNALYNAQRDLYQAQVALEQLDVSKFQTDVRRRQELAEHTEQRRQALQQLELSSNLYVLNTEIRSPYSGEILETLVKPGDLITATTPIVSMQGTTNELEAHIFLNSSDGKRLASNFHNKRTRAPAPSRWTPTNSESLSALLAPVSVKKEEFGMMRGVVLAGDVSDYPVTPLGMQQVLQNPTLVIDFSRTGAPIEVTVRLLQTNTVSGFVWTSTTGPSIAITSGTLCDGTITIEHHRPISLVLPFLRKLSGAGGH